MPNPDLTTLARKLWEPIYPPRKPRPKTQASWRQLKPGQRLKLKERFFTGREWCEPGTLFEICSVDSQGVDLTPLTGPDGSGRVYTVRWMRPEWQGMFDRARSKTKRKAPK